MHRHNAHLLFTPRFTLFISSSSHTLFNTPLTHSTQTNTHIHTHTYTAYRKRLALSLFSAAMGDSIVDWWSLVLNDSWAWEVVCVCVCVCVFMYASRYITITHHILNTSHTLHLHTTLTHTHTHALTHTRLSVSRGSLTWMPLRSLRRGLRGGGCAATSCLLFILSVCVYVRKRVGVV
jgi:hypothetical protein